MKKPEKASGLSQAQCLAYKINFITTFNKIYNYIQNVVKKHWQILKKEPYLNTVLPAQQQITYRRQPTIKTILAPSKLRQYRGASNIVKTKGAFKCSDTRCQCCKEIMDTFFFYFCPNRRVIYHQSPSYMSSYVVYLLLCICNQQYVG